MTDRPRRPLPDATGGFLGTRRRPPVVSTRTPSPPPLGAPVAPAFTLTRPDALSAPTTPLTGRVGAAPGTADALVTRYTDALGHDPEQVVALRALTVGLLAEQLEALAVFLESAAASNEAARHHRDAAPGLRFAASVVRGWPRRTR